MKQLQLSAFSKITKVFMLLSVVLLSISSCSKSRKKLTPIQINPAFSSYVLSFTSGVVSNNSSIRVRFVQEIEGAVAGELVQNNPFTIKPKLQGKAFWVDAQTIEFVPQQYMPSGEVFTVTCNVAKYLTLPKELSKLTFRFQVKHQGVEYSFKGFESHDLQDYTWQKIHGEFITADNVEPAVFAKSVSVALGSKKLPVQWKQSEDYTKFEFTIDSVPRIDKPQIITIECNGKSFGLHQKSTQRLTIPAKDDFSVQRLIPTTKPTTCVSIFFSDPLDKTQEGVQDFFMFGNYSFKMVVEGSVAKLYPTQSIKGEVLIEVLAGLKNSKGKALEKAFECKTEFVSNLPEVELIGEGTIVPDANGILFPFRAVSLSAVDVRIIQIFENNITQFLQLNQYDGTREIKRVGRIVYNQEVPLTSDKPINYGEWNNFSLDISQLIDTEPGAIYRIQISFRKKHSLYACSNADEEEVYREPKNEHAAYDQPSYYYDDYEYGDYYNYSWSERNNPCSESYYIHSSRKVSRNLLASNFGIIAKAGSDGKYHVIVTDLRTTKPLSGIEVELRNFQNQVLASAKTNSEGMCVIHSHNKPFLLLAKDKQQRGYLRLDDASSLSVSMFNVQGQELHKGVKGFIYGERGVWRPGDSLYITFILEDKNKSLPINHPVVFELYTPENQLVKRTVKTNALHGFYTFFTKTDEDDPTGNWLVKIKVGGSTFSKTLKIETVKPNRMKMTFDVAESDIILCDESKDISLQVDWLHGAVAQNAKVVIDATMHAAKTVFNEFDGYVFDDPTKSFESEEFTLFDGRVNAEGEARVHIAFDKVENSPGMVDVQLRTRAFDAGGDFSTDRFLMKYSPYTSYVGLKMPQGKGWNNALFSNENTIVPLAVVDQQGKPMSGQVVVEIFSVYWRWWWDASNANDLAHYISNNYRNLLYSDTLTVTNGTLMYDMNLGIEHWGRKFIRVTNIESGHSAGTTFYTTYKGWWSNASTENPGGAEMLQFETNKKVYSVGEQVQVELPVAYSGRALVSIENGSKVLKTFWVETQKNAKFEFEATEDMSPNVYIHISYIQPHNQQNNQLPIRMYGIESIRVENPKTHINPIIVMNDVLQPEQTFSVSVHEKDGKPMTYTIAIVDDGLLDITRFKTPNPWQAFYMQEALGVRTWDLYKYVAGAFAGRLSGLLQIGGDEYFENAGKKDSENTNRFKPVVMVHGPFEVTKGATSTHTFTMPNYVGSVRCMVVAGQDGAFGSAEKTIPVRQPLMVLPTIPRVVSPSERIKIPVTVFAMDKSVKSVNVSLQTDACFKILDGASRTITFSSTGEQVVEFSVQAKEMVTVGKISITAVSGQQKAHSETHLHIHMPNPVSSQMIHTILEPGKTWEQTVSAFGISGTNVGKIEISTMKPIDLERRLQYLIQYPHGCSEQITSGVFPQLFLHLVTNLTKEQKAQTSENVKEGIARLQKFQLSSGAFSYWQGEEYVSEWSTNYIGHFFLEAQKQGYELPYNFLQNWVSFQTRKANEWRANEQTNRSDDVIQAYRLYTLALAKKPAESAMNRMRETKNISNTAKWRLAAAYAMNGKPEVAKSIIASVVPESNTEYYTYTFGSETRDKAMILETVVLMNDKELARIYADEIAEELAKEQWMSTQTTAYALLATSKFMASINANDDLKAQLQVSGVQTSIQSDKHLFQHDIDFSQKQTHSIKVENTSKSTQFVRITLQGVAMMSDDRAESAGLQLSVAYFDMKGNPLDPKKIKQGTDFYAEVTVAHASYKPAYTNVTLEQLFASGWEIMNTRMELLPSIKTADKPRYQDVRDDRVYSYFDLQQNERKTFRVFLHAAYTGRFYLPAVYCQPMYDNTVYAKVPGYWVEVVK